jgi:hypothetical protein
MGWPQPFTILEHGLIYSPSLATLTVRARLVGAYGRLARICLSVAWLVCSPLMISCNKIKKIKKLFFSFGQKIQ